MSMERRMLAIPSEAPGGVAARRSGHFGKAYCFTLVELDQGQIGRIQVVGNEPHGIEGCLSPVQLLRELGTTDLVVAGIGGRPLLRFLEAGISVYHDVERFFVREIAEAFLQDKLIPMGLASACDGHGGCHSQV